MPNTPTVVLAYEQNPYAPAHMRIAHVNGYPPPSQPFIVVDDHQMILVSSDSRAFTVAIPAFITDGGFCWAPGDVVTVKY